MTDDLEISVEKVIEEWKDLPYKERKVFVEELEDALIKIDHLQRIAQLEKMLDEIEETDPKMHHQIMSNPGGFVIDWHGGQIIKRKLNRRRYVPEEED